MKGVVKRTVVVLSGTVAGDTSKNESGKSASQNMEEENINICQGNLQGTTSIGCFQGQQRFFSHSPETFFEATKTAGHMASGIHYWLWYFAIRNTKDSIEEKSVLTQTKV